EVGTQPNGRLGYKANWYAWNARQKSLASLYLWVSYNNNLLSIFVLGAKPSADSFYLKPQNARLVLQL
ncbi:hypothetical protein D6U67_07590, partial [Vibrio cholerae]|nr:hypothetical protein [Vibrio cholerae]